MLELGKIATWDGSRGLVVNSNLEASRTPFHKLNGPLCLDVGNRNVHVLGNHISAIQQAAGNVVAMTRVALHHLAGRLKAGTRDLADAECLVVGLLCRDDWSIGDQRKVD